MQRSALKSQFSMICSGVLMLCAQVNAQQLGVDDPAVQWLESEGGNGHWYAVVPGDWNQAQAFAQSMCPPTNLVSINSAAEQQWLIDVFGPFGDTPVVFHLTRRWIGLSDTQVENSWQWVNEDQDIFSAWASGEPNGGSVDGHDYAYLGRYQSGAWNDGPLDNALFGIVEWNLPPNVVSFTSNNSVDAVQTIGGHFQQLAEFSSGPPEFGLDSWDASIFRHTDFHQRSSFSCDPAVSGIITTTGGHVQELTVAPVSVELGQLESNDTIWAFKERASERVGIGGLLVDLIVPDSFVGPITYNQVEELTPGFIPEGTLVTSHFLHDDTVGKQVEVLGGSVTFDSPILGVILRDDTLDATDGILGYIGEPGPSDDTAYPTGLLHRWWEMGGQFGFITISDDRRTISVNGEIENVVDHMRVLTLSTANDPLSEPFVDAIDYILGADEVTVDNCSSAWYRFTFDLPQGFADVQLSGVANIDQFGVVYLNGQRITAEILASDAANLGIDRTDAEGLPLLSSPTIDSFNTSCGGNGLFVEGENELIFGVFATGPSPTGLEFQATLLYRCMADLNGDGVFDFFDISDFLTAFSAGDLDVVDFTHDGALNFFDVSAFLQAFSVGCP